MININDKLPPFGVPVIGYNHEWVDEDFNHKGMRECFRTGDGTKWYSAFWDDYQDTYTNRNDQPTHWQPLPQVKG